MSARRWCERDGEPVSTGRLDVEPTHPGVARPDGHIEVRALTERSPIRTLAVQCFPKKLELIVPHCVVAVDRLGGANAEDGLGAGEGGLLVGGGTKPPRLARVLLQPRRREDGRILLVLFHAIVQRHKLGWATFRVCGFRKLLRQNALFPA